MAKSKQHTECGAYSAQDLDSSGGPDRVRNTDWGPVEKTVPPVRALDADYLVDKQNFSAPAKFPKAKTQTKNWQ